MADPRDTPAMRQYYRFKREHPDCLLLFRIGDFYETFDDDAVTLSRAVGLTLTQRTEGVPMAGMPFHQLDTYLRRLVDKGFKVAVCDQIEDAAQAKARASQTPKAGKQDGKAAAAVGIIQREVSRVLTPGTLVDESLLQADAQATLAAVSFPDGGNSPTSPVHAAVVDLSTGRFVLIDSTVTSIVDELVRRSVTELLFSAPNSDEPPPRVRAMLDALGIAGSGRPAWHFRPAEALEAIKSTYGVSSLAGFGLSESDPCVPAAGAVLRYLRTTQAVESDEAAGGGDSGRADVIDPFASGRAIDQPGSVGPKRPRATLAHLQPPKREDDTSICQLDATSLRALEVLQTMRATAPGGRRGGAGGREVELDGSLAGVFATTRTFAGCRTSMGKRLLRDWLCRPSRDLSVIEGRQRCVSTLVEDQRTAETLDGALGSIQDVARIAARVALGRATPRDLVGLGRSVGRVRALAEAVEGAPAFASSRARLLAVAGELTPLSDEIARVCVESPPGHLREGGLVRDGVDALLDEARTLQKDAAGWMAQYQASLIAEHELPSLKVGYNKVFGYYIELPAAQARRAPDIFTRKQTLKSAERYITPELREFERKVTTAEARALEREQAIYLDLCAKAAEKIGPINTFADVAAELDVLRCFALKAARRGWVRPTIVDAPVVRITQGRHPVLDELLENGFVPNDVALGCAEESEASAGPSLALITGPNMAGKSTFIRQTALLVLLAHAGSFIPAQSAAVGLTDRIFTRVGADDALHAGQSTFMVEMTETARILNHATARSLIVLDEIGRGTSTLDGLSLAWAIAETLASVGGERGGAGRGPRTLFATHYHELTDLEEMMPGRVRNLHVSVREWGDDIVFLHRILPGRTDRSYGIHVAKLAGMPGGTVARAKEVLESLTVQHGLGTKGAGAGAETGETGRAGVTRNGRSGRSVVSAAGASEHGQLALFTRYVPHPAVEALMELKLDSLTPLQAFDALRRLKEETERTPGA
ncbi:MAG: DNA mismatch repair protein MutS [Phycisphaeraceae bacterium]|nr:DNA mismatch repair protein MutS [Phycisphaeraceae bacterium]